CRRPAGSRPRASSPTAGRRCHRAWIESTGDALPDAFRRACNRGLTTHGVERSITTSFHNEVVIDGADPGDGSAQHGLRGARRPDPAGDPRAARLVVGRPDRGGARAALPDDAAGRLAAPQGPRGGGPDLAVATGHGPAEPPRGGAAQGRLGLARSLSGVL